MTVDVGMWSNYLCDHCGSSDTVQEHMILRNSHSRGSVSARLCHTYPNGHMLAGETCEPDCFLLVTQGFEELGDRILSIDCEEDDDSWNPLWDK